MQNLSSDAWGALSTEMNKDLQGLATKIIMPAGDVFMFDGLNTDSGGNVYSSITYSTISGGSQTKSIKAKAVTSTLSTVNAPRTRLEQARGDVSAVQALMQANQENMKATMLNGFPSPTLLNTHKALEAALRAAQNGVGAAMLMTSH